MSSRTSASLLTALALVACANSPPTRGAQILMPGVLDIPVRAADTIPDDCYFDPPAGATGGCVEFSMRDGQRAAHAYIEALEARGWTTLGANDYGTARWFNKPVSETCAQRLVMSGGEQPSAMERAAARASDTEHLLDIGIFTFMLENEPRCGARRDEP